MRLLIAAALTAASACATLEAQPAETRPEAEVAESCRHLLSVNGSSVDWTSIWITPDNGDETVATLGDAENAVRGALASINCDVSIVKFEDNGACAFVGGYDSDHLVCKVEDQRLGAFSIVNSTADGSIVTWSRWD